MPSASSLACKVLMEDSNEASLLGIKVWLAVFIMVLLFKSLKATA
jgi:hypothetical protein